MHRLMKFVKGNPAMQEIFKDALNRLEKEEPLAPAQKIVINEILTRANARLSEIQLEQTKKLKQQIVIPNTKEQNDLQQAIEKLEVQLRKAL